MSDVQQLIAEARSDEPTDWRALAWHLADALEARVSGDDREALFEAIADRLGEHDKAGSHEIADSGEYETKLSGVIDVENLAEFLAPAVLAAGFRRSPEPRQVGTDEELDALPHRTYVRGRDGFGHVKHLDHWILTAGSGEQHDASGIELPATVLWVPDTEGSEK